MLRNQLGVLSALDRARLQWYHIKAVVIAGMGIFTDAYDLFCISTITSLLGRIYYFNPTSSTPGTLPKHIAFAISYHHSQKNLTALKITLYSFTLFFSNFGPNVTTFIVPAEIFPARLRCTCHGISGAAGKAGAVIGTIVFLYADDLTVVKATVSLLLLAVASAVGFLLTFLIPESMGKSLEEISGENDEEQVVELGRSQSSASRTAPSE